jgi:NADPH:quinone reductase-like Zn-dependent oxidoreductase
MRAYILEQPGGVENLVLQDLVEPQPLKNEVQIRVKALSINPVDVKSRKGKSVYQRIKDQSPIILGWDVSGVVSAVGEQTSTFKIGDEVFGMVNFPGHGKAYAEVVTAPESHLATKPRNVTHEEAAASSLAALTAYQFLVKTGFLKSGHRILIHGAAGGVGHFAVQFAKKLNAHVIVTASEYNREFLNSFGVDQFVDYTKQDFTRVVRAVDVVFDTMGGDVLINSFRVVKDGGLIITIPSGTPQEILDSGLDRNIKCKFMMVESNGEDMLQIAKSLETGKLSVKISSIFAFSEIHKAHVQVESGKTRGKVVVKTP